MKKGIFGVAVIFFIFGGLLAWFVPSAWFSKPKDNAPTLNIVIDSEAEIHDVAVLLKDKGLINSSLAYEIYGMFDVAARKSKAGAYTLKSGTNFRQIARTLSLGPAREEIQVKVIEGWNNKMIGQELLKIGVSVADWSSEVGDGKAGEPMAKNWRRDYLFLKDLPENASLEGYLFPDTYRVWKDQLPNSLITKQLAEFETRAVRLAEAAQKQGRTMHQMVILASIVEKEVADPEDRKIVAGIFLNRLKIGMPLQSDATISYITGSGRTRSNLDELAIDSPYNSYKYKDLPPGPICNPGDSALEAVINPKFSEYLYFLTDKEGKIYFARTLEEHRLNRQSAFQE